MKQTINLGTYGWRHQHWTNSFYPEDLPVEEGDDWRLAYYSNEFNSVLVPASHWQAGHASDCEDWLDSVHSGFRFFVECHGNMFDSISLDDLITSLKKLKPQLSALVFLDGNQLTSDAITKQFIELAEVLDVEVFGGVPGSVMRPVAQKIWRPDGPRTDLNEKSPSEKKQSSHFAFFENELLDLRSVRVMVEQFAVQIHNDEAETTIIVNHAQLQADNLSKFRSVLGVMGY